MNRFLSEELCRLDLNNIRKQQLPYEYDPERHRLLITAPQVDEAAAEISFRLPVTFPAPGSDLSLPEKKLSYIILLIQSGSCAVGYFENGKNLDHKVFRAYMVRKKRGVSQVKHLKTKGKSRAGSRVRLAETMEFFEDINERLQTYFTDHEIAVIALSCSKILIPYLFNAKTATPFTRKDPRIFRIPKHIHTPIYEVLLDTNKFLLKGELIFEENQAALIQELLSA